MHAALRRTRFALVLAVLPALAHAQRPAALTVEVPAATVNSALDQQYSVLVRNRGAAAVTLHLASIAVRVADTAVEIPLAIRGVGVDRGGPRSARDFAVPPGASLRLSISTRAPRPLGLPRDTSHLIVTFRTTSGPVRAEGALSPVDRCLRCNERGAD